MKIHIFCYVTLCRFLNMSCVLLGIPLRLIKKAPPAGHSLQKPEFNPGPVRVGFVVGSVALKGVCHRVLLFCPFSIISPMLNTDIHSSTTDAIQFNPSNWRHRHMLYFYKKEEKYCPQHWAPCCSLLQDVFDIRFTERVPGSTSHNLWYVQLLGKDANKL